ncbi:MAG: hypothetical protein JWL70_2022, partial [Acidimicrobiia bacterium]|nr:hypothetical protein [Acidimicrobiia bacterium]
LRITLLVLPPLVGLLAWRVSRDLAKERVGPDDPAPQPEPDDVEPKDVLVR